MEGINRRLPPIEVTPALRKRFFAKVRLGEASECWPWLASTRSGYGAIKVARRVHSCHRVSYVLANGEPADGQVIAHKCDNKVCCNPLHLEAVSPAKNNRDAFDRLTRFMPRGEQMECSVLNDELVIRIRRLHIPGVFSVTRIARLLGVSRSAVKGVIEGRNWKHVKETA